MSEPKNTPSPEPRSTTQPEVKLDEPKTTGNPVIDPNIELYQWLNDKGYIIDVEALSEKNPFLATKGFVLTDRPLLVVTVKKKGSN